MADLNVLKKLRSTFPGVIRWTDHALVADGKVTSLPTCNVDRRGAKTRIDGAAGVADATHVCLKNASDAYAWQQTSPSPPTGAIVAYAAATAPIGWLLCDGTAVSRTTYATLFALISTTYGVGDGSTTFNVPNLKSRFPIGLDAADAAMDALGETGGAKTVTLTGAESGVPVHAHANTLAADASTHDHDFGNASNTTTTGGGNRLTNVTGTAETETGGSHTHTLTGGVTDNTAAAAASAHNNLPPYLTLNFVIKH